MKTLLGEKTTLEIGAIAREKGCRLLAIEAGGSGRSTVLRLVLEREDGAAVTVEDCESVSRDASAVLDASDEISHSYTLEVSSAGLDRKLYSLEDARRFVGNRVRVQTQEPVTPQVLPSRSGRLPAISPARNFAGRLESVDADVLTVVDEADRKIYNVRFGDIRLARLEFAWPERGDRRAGS